MKNLSLCMGKSGSDGYGIMRLNDNIVNGRDLLYKSVKLKIAELNYFYSHFKWLKFNIFPLPPKAKTKQTF